MKKEELGMVASTCALSIQIEAEESAVEDLSWVDFQVTAKLFKTKISSSFPPPHPHMHKE